MAWLERPMDVRHRYATVEPACSVVAMASLQCCHDGTHTSRRGDRAAGRYVSGASTMLAVPGACGSVRVRLLLRPSRPFQGRARCSRSQGRAARCGSRREISSGWEPHAAGIDPMVRAWAHRRRRLEVSPRRTGIATQRSVRGGKNRGAVGSSYGLQLPGSFR